MTTNTFIHTKISRQTVKRKPVMTAKRWSVALLLALAALPLFSQQRITLEAAISKALKDYPGLTASRLQAQSDALLRKSANALGDIEISGGGEEIGRGNDAVYTLARLRQSLDFFGSSRQRRRLQAQAGVAQAETGVMERELSRQVCLDYIDDYAAQLRYENMVRTDSLYTNFSEAARVRYEAKAISLLEYQTALNRSQQVRLALAEARKDLDMAHASLSRWLSGDTLYMAAGMPPAKEPAADASQESHPQAVLAQQRLKLAQAVVKETEAQRLPKFFVEAGIQKIGSTTGYYAWQVGLSLCPSRREPRGPARRQPSFHPSEPGPKLRKPCACSAASRTHNVWRTTNMHRA
jgi:cobalt-zinc-cadmium resistance protein CzcA